MGISRLASCSLRALLDLRDAAVVALAGFGAVNLVLGLLGRADRNDLWVRGASAPALLVDLAVGGLALGLLLRRSRLARAAALVLAALAAIDAGGHLALLRGGRLAGGASPSLSLVLAVVLATWASRAPRPRAGPRLGRLAAVGVAAAALVLLHLLTFGATDYRRPANAAVVFGAAVRPDGSPSGSLRDRTRTACRLYHEGLVGTLVLSGGQGPAVPISEPACMARVAREAGVPEEALILDETGVTSAASLAAVDALARERRWSRVLLVSHDYHLARLHLLARSLDVEACTVPAVETVPWPTKPVFVLREIAAWGWHFLSTAGVASAR